MKYLPNNFKLLLCGPLILKGRKKTRDLKYFDEIKEHIKENNLKRKITLIPNYVEVVKYFKKADLYLMPSYEEGLGNTVIESLAAGIPVIANSHEPSFREIIKNNKNGFLKKMKPELWAKSIIKNINKLNAEKTRKYSKKIFELADEKRVDKFYIKIFKNLIVK